MSYTTASDVYYDPYDVDINADPYPIYARLRDEAPIYHNEKYDFWMLTRHADIEEALTNWQVFSQHTLRYPRCDPIGLRTSRWRHHVRGPAHPHDAQGPPVPGLHPSPDGRARGPSTPVLHRLP